MRLQLVILATALAVLAGFGSQAAARETGKVNGCKLLASTIAQDAYWKANLTRHIFGTIGRSQRCEFASKPPQGSVTSQFLVVLYFGAARSSSSARLAVRTFVAQARQAGKPVVRVRGIGADEAWAVELQQSPGANVTQAYWSKGRFWGWLSVAGPELHGDIDDAKDLLKPFLRRLPR